MEESAGGYVVQVWNCTEGTVVEVLTPDFERYFRWLSDCKDIKIGDVIHWNNMLAKQYREGKYNGRKIGTCTPTRHPIKP